MSKLGLIEIGFALVHLGIVIGMGHFGIGIDHAECAIS